MAHYDFAWSRNSLPSPESLLRYVEAVLSAEKPILAHCEGGTHRTGAAAAIWLLLRGHETKTARGQFGPMFRDAPIGDVVRLYEMHGAGMPFAQWVKEKYPSLYSQWMEERGRARHSYAVWMRRAGGCCLPCAGGLGAQAVG